MIAFVKSRKNFKTVAAAEAVSWEVPLASIEDDVGTITLCGTSVSRGNEGDFLIMDGHIWLIDQVSPEEQQTVVSVVDVRSVFDRLLPFAESTLSIGAYLAQELENHYKAVADDAYAMPYLQISNTDVTEFLGPTVTDGLYSLKAYMRKVNRLRDVQVQFSVSGDSLLIAIFRRDRPTHNIVFDDGRSQLVSRSYSRSSIAKVTAYQFGVAVDYYLDENNNITTQIPIRRAEGQWQVVALEDEADMTERVSDIFSQNSNSHRIEWRSSRAFDLYDNTRIRLDGGLMTSYISYIGISSSDNRFHYKSGELATTLTERLKGGKL